MTFIPSKYQQDIFDFVENGKGNAIIEAVAGCLAGESIINFNRAGKGFKLSIEKAFIANKGKVHVHLGWDKSIPTMVRSLQGEVIKLHEIDDIVQSGIKKTLRAYLSDGREICGTPEHPIMTKDGWVELKDLRNRMVMCDTLKAKSVKKNKVKRHDEMVRTLRFHPFGQKDAKNFVRIEKHRAIFEANLNDITLGDFISILKTDEEKSKKLTYVDMKKFDIHHKDFDKTNNHISNLMMMDKIDHQRIHASPKNLNQGIPEFVECVRVETDKEQMTYDIICKDPHRNFVANGIVVHNSGKTSTLLKMLELIPKGKRVVFVAFSKAIVDELRNRAPEGVDIMTLNSMGFRAVKMNGINAQVDTNKLEKLWKELITENQGIDIPVLNKMKNTVKSLVGAAKFSGIVPGSTRVDLTPDSKEEWLKLMDFYDFDFDDAIDELYKLGLINEEDTQSSLAKEQEYIGKGINLARKLLMKSLQYTTTIDFDDQVYYPVAYEMKMYQYDYVLVDESQDLSTIQRLMLLRVLKRDGRFVAVGDENQAIFGFRGSDVESMNKIKIDFNCTSLPLSISYRCPNSVVQEAKTYVPHIEARPGAPDGTVLVKGLMETEKFVPGDMIICRMNAPLVKTAFSLLKRDIPFKYLGRDFGASIIKLIEKVSKENGLMSIEDFSEKLESWYLKEKSKLEKRSRSTTSLEEKYDAITISIEVNANLEKVNQLVTMINRIFNSDPRDCVLLTTIHKGKGLEANRVYILNQDMHDYIHEKNSHIEWKNAQERNMKYVAVTRAKKELYYIQTDKKKRRGMTLVQ